MSPLSESRTPPLDVHGDYTMARSPNEARMKKMPNGNPSGTISLHRRILGYVAQFVMVSSLAVYIFGHLFYHSSGYARLNEIIGSWYGVSSTSLSSVRANSATIHREMVRPTYFLLITVLPLVVAVVVFEFLRDYNRQIASKYLLRASKILRRRPGTLKSSFGELLYRTALVGGNAYVFQHFYRARLKRFKDAGRVLDSDTYLEMIALTFGYVCIFNLAFLFLPATRNSVWMEFLNISYANGLKYHGGIAKAALITGVLHSALFYSSWIRQGIWVKTALPCGDCAVGAGGKDPLTNFFGLVALVCFVLIWVTSRSWVRRRMYNVFYYTHHLFIVAVVFAVLHWNNIIMWILPSLVLYLISRSLSSTNGFTPVVVKEFTTLRETIGKITVARSITCANSFKVGQFVYLNVPAISKIQWHPFTIASSPLSSKNSLTILLKPLGDWTSELLKHTEACKANNVLPIVYMDGFYGASLQMYDEYSTVCLVGGGIGSTPMFAILDDMVCKAARGAPLRQKVHSVFAFREMALLEEIHPLLARVKQFDPQQEHFSFELYITNEGTVEQLNAYIDYERLGGKPHARATVYDTSISRATPIPFSEPLRSPGRRTLMFLSTFFNVCLLLAIVKYGSKIQAKNENLWPLQNFVEIVLVFAIVALTVFTFVCIELKQRCHDKVARSHVASSECLVLATKEVDSSKIRTLRDLISEYSVKIEQRPDATSIMRRVLQSHDRFKLKHPDTGNGIVGLFVSGPKALKASIRRSIAELGGHHFDVHEEEFEL